MLSDKLKMVGNESHFFGTISDKFTELFKVGLEDSEETLMNLTNINHRYIVNNYNCISVTLIISLG